MIGLGFPCLLAEHPSLDRSRTSCRCAFFHHDIFRCSPHFCLSVGHCGARDVLWLLLNTSVNCLQVCFWGFSFFCHHCLFVLDFCFVIQRLPSCPYRPFLCSGEIPLIILLLYRSVDEMIIPCTPQFDVAMSVHLIRCHLERNDVVQPRSLSISIFCTISVGDCHLPFVATARPGRRRFAIALFHNLVPHQLLEASLVIFASLSAQWATHLVELLDAIIACTQQSQLDVNITRDVEFLDSCATSFPQDFGHS